MSVTRVKDERQRTWYWVDDAFIDHHAKCLSPAAQCLYQFYARHADRHGFSNWSRKDKAEALNLSETTVRTADKELAQKGYIRIEQKLRDNGSQSNNHVFMLPLGDQVASTTEQDTTRGQNPHPLKESSVVVSSQSDLESESITTTTEIPARGVNSEEGSKSDPHPTDGEALPYDSNPDRTQAWLDLWAEEYGVSGRHMRRLAILIGYRDTGADEMADILDYFDAVNEYVGVDHRLTPAWIVSQFQELVARSPNSPKLFRWMDHAPRRRTGRPEYHRPWTPSPLPPLPEEPSDVDAPPTNADALHLWASALSDLEMTISEPAYQTWLRPTRALTLVDDTLTLQVVDAYTPPWIAKFDRDIVHALKRAAGRPVSYRVEVQDRQPAREEHAA